MLRKKKKKQKHLDIERFGENPEVQIRELKAQIAASEREYEAVTSYLTDIQRIERLEPSVRQVVNDAARGITNLNRDRKKYQTSGKRLADSKYRIMERYEKQIPDELREMHDQEQYHSMICGDLRQLEGERAVIEYERDDAAAKKQFLKKIAIAGAVLVMLLFGGLLYIGQKAKTDMTVPLLLTVAMAAMLAAYIAVVLTNCDRILRESVYKMNRVIKLLNKVKIKLVNCTNTLEYSYEKYGVESYRQLAEAWEKYVMTRDEERRYRNSAEFLEQYNQQLVQTLQKAGLEDAQIWVYQTEALLDEKEMVEVRHHLNVRRNKIRERLEYNKQQLELLKAEM